MNSEQTFVDEGVAGTTESTNLEREVVPTMASVTVPSPGNQEVRTFQTH